MLKMFKKKKYIAVFLLKEQNSYTIDIKKRFNPSNTTTISYKSESYPIDISAYTYTKGLYKFFCFDIESKEQLVFQNSKKPSIDGKVIDLILRKKIVPQLTSDLTNTNFRSNIFNIIIGLIIGALIGYTIAGFI